MYIKIITIPALLCTIDSYVPIHFVQVPCDFILQFGDVGHIVLDIEEECCIPGSAIVVFLKLLPERLVPVHPAHVAILTGKLETKEVDLMVGRGREGGREGGRDGIRALQTESCSKILMEFSVATL